VVDETKPMRLKLRSPRFVIIACLIFVLLGAALAVMYFEGIIDGPWPYTDGYRVIAEGPTRILSDYRAGEPADEKLVIAVLQNGESADVITARSVKDAMVYKVRLKDGRKGFVSPDAGKFRLVPEPIGEGDMARTK
jgi:hypothetical protein